ncbi:hypothetical protein CPT_Maja_040 [Burkholderia phage Maja]|uniref:Uncharacterized protein n=1 Tax=Burkholderia phage Maja TaxID=2767571 RepID=A0A7S6R767_9CAUD|nr:hypothetical protein CPT_Maja_040 [Burkholderia phage Maja]
MTPAISPDFFYVDRAGRVFPVKALEKGQDYLIEFDDGSRTRTNEFNLFRTKVAANIAAANRASQNVGGKREPKTFFQK